MRHAKPVRLKTAPTGGLAAVWLKTAPTGPDKSGSKPRGESVYLFLEFTIKAEQREARKQARIDKHGKLKGNVFHGLLEEG